MIHDNAIEDGLALTQKFINASFDLNASPEDINPIILLAEDFIDNAYSYIIDPAIYADYFIMQFNNLVNAAKETAAGYAAISSFYQYSSETETLSAELPIPPTITLNQTKLNRATLDQHINVIALSFGYLQTTLVSFENEDDIIVRSDELNDQFKYILNNNTFINILNVKFKVVNSETTNILEAMRIDSHQYLNDLVNNAKRVDIVHVNNSCLLSLVYTYYGDLKLKDTINDLNDFGDPSLLSGKVRMLTS